MNDTLYCCRLEFAPADSGAVAELLEALELDYSCYEDVENGGAYAVVYSETAPEAEANFAALTRAAGEWRSFGVELTSPPRRFEMKKEDWSEIWKKYFNVIPISERLIVKPSWLKYNANPGQVVLEIDPGMSFGTGQHATTSYCLKIIDRLAGKAEFRSLLDAGCGSGILALAGALLGYETVTAFDNDPECMRVSQENFELNHIAPGRIDLSVGDAAVWQDGRRYDLVAANILGHLLIRFKDNIASWVRPGGSLVLAGILAREFDGVSEAFAAIGFSEVERFSEKEWTSGLFHKE